MKTPPGSVKEEVLLELQQLGITSPILEARLQYAENSHLLSQYLYPMAGEARVFPNMCSPQASGRLSVSDPPLINFTADKKYGLHGIRDVVHPDVGTEWCSGDLEAVEARLIGHACGDKVDEEVFRRGYDIHTITAIRMLKWPEPPFEPTKKNLFSEVGQDWCSEIGQLVAGTQPGDAPGVPYSDSHPYRTLAKNCRYTLQYALNEKAMTRYAVPMRMKKEILWAFGKLYLQSKPWLTSWKAKIWNDCWRTHESRTAFGRRRRLVGSREAVMKEGLNHRIQGTVADLMKLIVARVCHTLACGIAYQSHDGFKFIFPLGQTPLAKVKELAERTWDIWGKPLFLPASWEIVQ